MSRQENKVSAKPAFFLSLLVFVLVSWCLEHGCWAGCGFLLWFGWFCLLFTVVTVWFGSCLGNRGKDFWLTSASRQMQYCEVSWKEVHHQSRDTLSKRIHLSSCFLILFPHLSGTLKLVVSSCPSPLTWTSFLFHQNLCPLRNSKQEKFKNKCYLSLNVIPNWRIVWAHTEEFNLFLKK